MPFVQEQFRARSMLGTGVSFAVQIAQMQVLRSSVSVIALAGALSLNVVAARADGGHGTIFLNVASGAGGTDGTLDQATGKNGDVATQASSGGNGGGGAVDLTTGNGAAGGAAGAGSSSTGIGQVYGAAGATGLAGLVSTTATSLDNAVVGGAGGAGQTAVANVNTMGGGGGGGVGLTTNAALTVTAAGSVTGGTGNGVNNAASGGGGSGIFSTALVTLEAGGKVTGGAGGGASGSSSAGGGGMGIVLATGGGLLNSGTITGGKGGGTLLSSGGDGGDGVWMTRGGTVVNSVGGSITGGAGGNGRYREDVQFNTGNTRGGLGGEGVKGSNITLINAGSISGAMGGTSSGAGAPAAVLANAVTFLGGVNTLELQAGSVITGNVVAFSAADTLRLGGETDTSFDVSQIGPTAQYRGFGIYEKTGTSTWMLTGTTSEVTPWTLFDGTLSVSTDGNLGAAASTLTFNGGTLQNTASFTSAHSMTLNAPGGRIETLGDLTLAGVISGPGALTKTGAATLTLTGDETYTGETLINAGALALSSGGSIAASSRVVTDGTFDISGLNVTGTEVQRLAGSGSVTLGDKILTLTNANDLFSGVISGTGGLTVSRGNQTLTGANSYSGATDVESGATLVAGKSNTFSAASGHNVRNGGTLALNGFGQSVASLSNSGQIHFGGNGATALNVAGNYTGNSGTLVINTFLGGDNSTTDILKVGGDTSGNTNLKVINRGGLGAQTVNGIEVVDVQGRSNGTFSLMGDYVTKDAKQAIVGGAYAYTLQQGGATTGNDGDWYLTSQITPCDRTDSCPSPVTPTARYNAGVPIYEGYLQNMQALNKLPTLKERVGERYWTGQKIDVQTNGTAVDDGGVWARIVGAHSHLEPDTSRSGIKQDINTFVMQAGVDGQFYESANGTLIAGITGQYGLAKGDISSFHGDGDISTDAWSIGATATWYGNSGFYVDGQAQMTWFDSDLNSSTVNQSIGDSRKATGYALSIEAGQRLVIDQNWSLVPQAQLTYSSVDANSFNDPWGSRVSLHNSDSLIGRIGIAANYTNSWKGDDGLTVNTTVYGIANLYQEMLDGSSVKVAGVDFDTASERMWGGIGAGGTYAWGDNKYAVYGEGSINTALNHFADSYALKGTAGFKVKW